MSSCVAELDGILQSMLEQKPPGVSAKSIAAITSLCNANVQSETVLIQKVYTHFKKAPANKKLGVLYVVDSVTRQWVDHARKSGQPTGSGAADGTFAAGVNHVTELLPSFMTDIIATAPEEQKAKIKKLIEIWERSSTFPAPMLATIKDKLNAPAASTTPTNSPPKDFVSLNQQVPSAPTPAQDTSSILANLQALANLANQNNASAQSVPTNGSSTNVTFPQNSFPQSMPASVNSAGGMPQVSQAVSIPAAANGTFSYPGMNGNGAGGIPQSFQNLLGGMPQAQPQQQPSAMPQSNPAVSVSPEVLQQQLQILQLLKAQGVPQEQWATLLPVLMMNAGIPAAGASSMPVANSSMQGVFGRDDSSRDYRNDQVRSPPGRYNRDRSRSRSPRGWDRRDASPRRNGRRDSPVYGDYSDRNGRGRDRRGNQNRGNDRGGNPFRQRSPDRYQRTPSPERQDHGLPPPGPKWIEYDRSIGDGNIKVLSRTLFVGGVTSSEDHLRSIFSAFGRVQTCIVNVDKRHAFVKMITRVEAVQAKDGMENYKNPEMQLRTRWGVGFGPRDCSDYQTGISIIPVDRLTEADKKWLLSAEYGGTGGKTIESYMCIEEPDIEIGAGVSSKAISRRMQTDKGGNHGPRSTRDPPPRDVSSGNDNFRNNRRGPGGSGGIDRDNGAGSTAPPAVPGFNQFPFMMPNGMMFPSGFMMPSANNQPPPPGAT